MDARSSDRPGRFLVRRGPPSVDRVFSHHQRAPGSSSSCRWRSPRLDRARPSVAIVGGGFGGIGAAVMLQPGGLPGRDGLRARRPDRRRLELQHLSGHRLRRALAPLRVLLRAQPRTGRGATRRGPRSRPTWRTWRAGTACSTGSGCAPRSRGASVRRGSAGAGLLETTAGPHEADVLVTACGQLSVPQHPADPGLEDFAGPAFHTARWRHDVDLAGKRVALVGTGCSSIQVGPVDPARGRAARRLPALARLDDPEDGLRVRAAGAAAVRARARGPAARPRADLRASWRPPPPG